MITSGGGFILAVNRYNITVLEKCEVAPWEQPNGTRKVLNTDTRNSRFLGLAVMGRVVVLLTFPGFGGDGSGGATHVSWVWR